MTEDQQLIIYVISAMLFIELSSIIFFYLRARRIITTYRHTEAIIKKHVITHYRQQSYINVEYSDITGHPHKYRVSSPLIALRTKTDRILVYYNFNNPSVCYIKSELYFPCIALGTGLIAIGGLVIAMHLQGIVTLF